MASVGVHINHLSILYLALQALPVAGVKEVAVHFKKLTSMTDICEQKNRKLLGEYIVRRY